MSVHYDVQRLVVLEPELKCWLVQTHCPDDDEGIYVLAGDSHQARAIGAAEFGLDSSHQVQAIRMEVFDGLHSPTDEDHLRWHADHGLYASLLCVGRLADGATCSRRLTTDDIATRQVVFSSCGQAFCVSCAIAANIRLPLCRMLTLLND